jgi:hypothetical protein
MSEAMKRRLLRLENPDGRGMSDVAEILERERRLFIERLRNPDPAADAREADQQENKVRVMEARDSAGDLGELEVLMLAGKRRLRAHREALA